MNEAQLRELLRKADAGEEPGEISVVRIRRQAMQRRRNERLGLGLLVLVAAMAGSALFHSRPAVHVAPPTQVATTGPSASQIQAVAAMRERIEIETAVLIAQRRASGAMPAIDPALSREAAAETLVITGDRRLARNDAAQAADAYHAAVTLFPDTEWGGRAQAALRHLQ